MRTERAASELISRQTSELATLKAGLEAEIEAVSVYNEEVTDWTKTMSKQLNQRINDVDQFINVELVVDVPTGKNRYEITI